MKKSYIFYFLVVLSVSAGGVLIAEGSLMVFVDVPSFIFTPLLPVIILLGHYSPREMVDSFRFAGKCDASEQDLKRSLLFFETLHRLVVISGLFAFMLGIVLLVYIQPPVENKEFGYFLAVCFLTIVYALFIIMTVTVPFQSAIKKKMIN